MTPHAMNRAELGLFQNMRHFNYKYKYYWENLSDDEFVLFDDTAYLQGPLPFVGKSVAIVGNGLVRGRGNLIDSHDIVVRVNYPYQWQQDPHHDGQRITHWAGLGMNGVIDPLRSKDLPSNINLDNIISRINEIQEFYCISHHHVQAYFWKDLKRRGLLERLKILWSTPMNLDYIERTDFGKDQFLISWITDRRFDKNGYGGWYGWDILFSGVRIALLAAISKPSKLSLFGMNFYTDGFSEPWDMHDIDLNKEVLFKTGHISRTIGTEFEIYSNA